MALHVLLKAQCTPPFSKKSSFVPWPLSPLPALLNGVRSSPEGADKALNGGYEHRTRHGQRKEVGGFLAALFRARSLIAWMKIGFAQINPTVGDLRGNSDKIVKAYDQLVDAGADLVSAPELAITGYPPQDLLFKSRFVPENLAVLDRLQKRLRQPALLVGFVDRNEGCGKPFHNAAALLERDQPMQKTYKSLLPTYDVFDEDRYFQPAMQVEPFDFRGRRVGITICEDIWTEHYLPRPLIRC